MHELSIATSLFELVTQQLQGLGNVRVSRLHLKIGALTCVHQDALQLSFELVIQDTPLQGATLEVELVPVSIYCPNCNAVQPLQAIQCYLCPCCGTPSADIRSGKELDLESIELVDVDQN